MWNKMQHPFHTPLQGSLWGVESIHFFRVLIRWFIIYLLFFWDYTIASWNPLWKGLLLRGSPRIPNHRAANLVVVAWQLCMWQEHLVASKTLECWAERHQGFKSQAFFVARHHGGIFAKTPPSTYFFCQSDGHWWWEVDDFWWYFDEAGEWAHTMATCFVANGAGPPCLGECGHLGSGRLKAGESMGQV